MTIELSCPQVSVWVVFGCATILYTLSPRVLAGLKERLGSSHLLSTYYVPVISCNKKLTLIPASFLRFVQSCHLQIRQLLVDSSQVEVPGPRSLWLRLQGPSLCPPDSPAPVSWMWHPTCRLAPPTPAHCPQLHPGTTLALQLSLHHKLRLLAAGEVPCFLNSC